MLILPETKAHSLSIRAKAMVFEDPSSRALLERIGKIAPTSAPVLITGETGTGKEIVARQLHVLSGRAEQPFLAVNAGAFSETLIETELFGHERGAFTGALSARIGWFEAAHGGTLFLDEIGDLPLGLQVKLLRVLQEGEVVRVGSRLSRKVDVRLVAATNVDLQAAMVAKRFREDLYYRLKVISLNLPPLRERPGDVIPLAEHFLRVYARKLNHTSVSFAESARARLLKYVWPGNIRELENSVHHALLVCRDGVIEADDLQLVSETRPLLCVPTAPATAAEALAATELDAELTAVSAPPMSPLPEEAEVAGPQQTSLPVLDTVFAQLLESKTPNLHERVEASLFAAAYRFSGQNQLETARLLGLSRHVVRARLLEQGALGSRGPRASSTRQLAPRSRPPAAANGSTIATEAAPHVLRLGYQKLGLLMLVKAQRALDTAFALHGIELQWQEYAGGIQMVEALRAGQLDAGGLGDCPTVVAQAEDIPIVYLAAEPPAPRGAALVVPCDSPLQNVAELRGRRVAVNRAAQAHYLLLKALEEAGVDSREVEIWFAAPEHAQQAFRRGELDAWSIWDPWLSSARLDFGARILRDGSGLMNNSVYYVAHRNFVEQKPTLVELLVQHVQATARWAQSDPERAAALVASDALSARAFSAALDRQLVALPITSTELAAQQDMADSLLRLQLIPRAVSVASAHWNGRLAG